MPGLIMLNGPTGDRTWRPTYEPSREHEFGDEQERPVVAHRVWQVRGATICEGASERFEWSLCGIHALCPDYWTSREEIAHCLSRPIAGRAGSPQSAVIHEDTAPPALQCTCGLSAFYDPFPARPGVSGVVTVSGRVILHDVWLRAERMRIECLALGERFTNKPEQREFIEGLAADWGVPIIDRADLAEFAQSIGSVVPADLRPSPAPE